MRCLSCGYYEATHGSQCESCALGDTTPDPRRAQRDEQYEYERNMRRLEQATEIIAAVNDALDQYDRRRQQWAGDELRAAVAKAVGR